MTAPNQTATTSNFLKTNTPTQTIFWSGLVVGVLDYIAAAIVFFVYFKMNPLQVLQAVAGGVYGVEAFKGGAFMTSAGLFFHFLIAYVIAIIYFYAYPKISILGKYKIASGLAYGLGIWLVMNLLVLPVTNFPPSPFNAGLAALGILWHMTLTGLPASLITHKYYAK